MTDSKESSAPGRVTRKHERNGRRVSAILGGVVIAVSATVLASSTTYFLLASDARERAAALLAESSAELELQEEREAELQREKESAAQEAKRAAVLLQSEIDNMAAIGLTAAGNGAYYRFADPDEYYCGYWSCAAVIAATGAKACPSSVYVEANIVSNGVAVGMTNGVLGALAPWSTGAVILQDYIGGDSFQLTNVKCY